MLKCSKKSEASYIEISVGNKYDNTISDLSV